jgi:hypothetical protein
MGSTSTPKTLTNLIPTLYEALDVVSREWWLYSVRYPRQSACAGGHRPEGLFPRRPGSYRRKRGGQHRAA